MSWYPKLVNLKFVKFEICMNVLLFGGTTQYFNKIQYERTVTQSNILIFIQR